MSRSNIKAVRLIEYLETLVLTEGARAGDTLELISWQKKYIRAVFSRPGNAALSIARGNGKSTLIAGIGAAALLGPLAIRRGLVLCVASSFGQARIVFDHILAFAGPAIEKDPERFRIWDTTHNALIEDKETGARVRCIGSDPARASGLAPSLVLADEPASWPKARAEKMRAVLRTSLGKQPDSRLLALGTQSSDPEHWFSKMLQRDYSQVHATRSKSPPFHRRSWREANPSLNHLPDLEKVIREEADEARTDPSLLAEFRALRLNQGTSEVLGPTQLLDAATWRKIEDDVPPDGPCVWGVDLSDGVAMAAVAAFWPLTGRLEAIAGFGDEPPLAERSLSDGVGRLYQDLHASGELIVTTGPVVSADVLIGLALSRWGRPAAVAADRWRERELISELNEAGVPRAALSFRGMGYRDGGEDVRLFRKAVLGGAVRPVKSLLLRAALAEAVTVMDVAGNSKLAKASEGGRRKKARDDACAAAILAVAEGTRRGVPSKRKVYHGTI